MANKPTLRFATREDVPIILGLIKELAEYENASDSVEATEASLALTLALAPSHHHNSHHKNDSSSHGHNSNPLPDAPLSSSSHSPPTQSTGYAKTILITAKPEDEVAGMALYFHNYSTWRAKPGIYLEDLFVKPKYRKRGYGTLLLKELAKEVVRIDGGRLEWSCLKWNEPSLKFYESLGAKQMDGWVGLRVDGEALEKLAKGEVEPAEEPEAEKPEG
ncbi:Peroxygenase 1 [Coniosporium apollinis]|uniref:Peroxygenase 1 n=1 Tax=Coniosporium apollinis TaxID=61459 RepID=A0ABQ9NLR6_9PEZI|nr:Peroxygenase 1 [Coniosporium apollinis]